MRFLIPLVAGAIGFMVAVAVVLVVVVLQPEPTPVIAPPRTPTPAVAPPTATPEPTPTATPTPRSTPRPTPTPPPIARCLSVDGRSLDMEKLLMVELLEVAVEAVKDYPGISPSIPSIRSVEAVNVRPLGGRFYRHTASYVIVLMTRGEAPTTTTIPVSGTLDANTCRAELD